MNILCSERGAQELAEAGLLRRWPGRVALVGIARAAQADTVFLTRDVVWPSTDDWLTPATAAFYEAMLAAPRLRWVHTYASGADRRIYGDLRARGVEVTNSAGANAGAVAQTALAGFLYFTRQLHAARRQQLARRWQPMAHDEIKALRRTEAMVVGWGEIGRRIGGYLSALGVSLRVLRQSGEPVPGAAAAGDYGRFHEWVGQIDWVFFACPLSPSTRGLFGMRTLDALRIDRPLGIVNVARGPLIDTEALLAAHQRGLVRHAHLDVFDTEPLPQDHPLWRCEDFLLTPHMAGSSDGNREEVVDRFLALLARRMEAGGTQASAGPVRPA